MNEERRIVVEEVDAVPPPPKARVEDAAAPRETFERKRDYLAGFLAQKPAPQQNESAQLAVYRAFEIFFPIYAPP